ncbi:MAG: hypothetical protein U5K30_04315 [Acidimicrobiales bacterium]|nr:hypothetical protein [Acidimicrobiales bacterium]
MLVLESAGSARERGDVLERLRDLLVVHGHVGCGFGDPLRVVDVELEEGDDLGAGQRRVAGVEEQRTAQRRVLAGLDVLEARLLAAVAVVDLRAA